MYEFGMFMLRVIARAFGVVLGVMIVAIVFAMAANASLQKYKDLGGEPARMIFVCEDRDAFDLALAGLERVNKAGPADPYFKDGTCVLTNGRPTVPDVLILSPIASHLFTVDDSKGNRVWAYRVSPPQGKTMWLAVWVSRDVGEAS